MKKQSNLGLQATMLSLIKTCKERGMRIKDFCLQNYIGKAMFYYWQKKMKGTSGKTTSCKTFHKTFILLPKHFMNRDTVSDGEWNSILMTLKNTSIPSICHVTD